MRVVGSVAIVLVLFAASLTQPVAAQQYGTPQGSWQGSCRNARTYGSTFSADCRANGGSYQHSSINVSQCRGGSVGNNNGQLFCESGYNRGNGGGWSGGSAMPQGSWQNSCRNARTYGNTFSADCRANGGSYQHSSINLSQCRGGSVGNYSGRLFCESGYNRGNEGGWSGGSAMPQGTWQSSCRNAYMRGSVLTASCSAGNGQYIRSSLNVSQCRRNSVANHNGRLSCGR